MASSYDLASSATPTQYRVLGDGTSSPSQEDGSTDGSWHDDMSKTPRNGFSASVASTIIGPRGASLAPSGPPPGSFSSDLKSIGLSRSATPRPDITFTGRGNNIGDEEITTTEQRQALIRSKIAKELKIKTGTENM